jgi:hypothetical protein
MEIKHFSALFLKRHKYFKTAVILLFAVTLLLASCAKSNTDSSSQVPYVAVNLNLNVNTTGYTALQAVGGLVDLANVGYRGIMVYRLAPNSIVAYDRTCTYDISDANGIVYAQSNATATCLECNSTYLMSTGAVSAGSSTIGLKKYTVNFNQTTGAFSITN